MSSEALKATSSVLEDVHKFLVDLSGASLPGSYSKTKDQLLQRIEALDYDFPSLSLSIAELEYDDPHPLPPPSSRKVSDVALTSGGSGSSMSPSASSSSTALDEDKVIEDVSAGSLSDDKVRSGFLKLKEKSWRRTKEVRKWCVIHSRVFYVFDNHNSSKQTAAYNIKNGRVSIADGAKPFSFELTMPDQSQQMFIAQDESDLRAWMEAVDEVSYITHNFDVELIDEETDSELEYDPPALSVPGPALSLPARPPSKRLPLPALPTSPTTDDAIQADDEGEELYDVIPEIGPPKVSRVEPPPVTPTLPSRPKRSPMPPPNKPRDLPLPPPPTTPSPVTTPSSFSSYKTITLDPIDYGNLYFGLFNCTADTDQELSFSRGQVIHIVNREYNDKDWWTGYVNGRIGLVPKTYLKNAYKRVV